MRAWTQVAVLLVTLTGCASVRLARPGQPVAAAGPPTIEAAIDLGGLPLAERGELSDRAADDRFTPGEWVAVVGENLADNPKVAIGGREVPIEAYLEDGYLLVRVPRGLKPRRVHRLSVTTAQGEASIGIQVESYVVGSDTDGNSLRFARIGRESRTLFEEGPTEIPFRRARYHAFTPDGALLYAIQSSREIRTNLHESDVVVVHLAAEDQPEKVATFRLELPSPPTEILVGPNGTLYILAERHLLLFETSNRLAPTRLATLELSDPSVAADTAVRCSDLVLLDGGRLLAVLEVWSNSLLLVDTADPEQPTISQRLDLAPGVDLPVSIDLTADPGDDTALWLLQGLNFRVAGKKIKEGYAAIKGSIGQAFASVSGEGSAKAVAPTEAEPSAEEESEGSGAPSRLLRLRMDGDRLVPGRSWSLPEDFYGLFALARGEELLVSGVNRDVFDFSNVDASLDGVAEALRVLGDSAQFGRIIRIGPDGTVDTVVQGMAVYFNLDRVPDGPLLYSVWRLGPKALPPSLVLNWGAEAADTDFVKMRSLDWWYIIPPYSYGKVTAQ